MISGRGGPWGSGGVPGGPKKYFNIKMSIEKMVFKKFKEFDARLLKIHKKLVSFFKNILI